MDTSEKVMKSDGCLLDNCVIENIRMTDEDFMKLLQAYATEKKRFSGHRQKHSEGLPDAEM